MSPLFYDEALLKVSMCDLHVLLIDANHFENEVCRLIYINIYHSSNQAFYQNSHFFFAVVFYPFFNVYINFFFVKYLRTDHYRTELRLRLLNTVLKLFIFNCFKIFFFFIYIIVSFFSIF